MIEKMQETIETVISGFVGQMIDRVGYGSIGGGLGMGAVQITQPQIQIADWLPGSLASIAAVLSVIGTIVLILKNIAEWYYSHKGYKREKMRKRGRYGNHNK